MAARSLLVFVFVFAACAAHRPVKSVETNGVEVKHFATVYNAVIDATAKRYPAFDEDPRIGRVATAWHVYSSIYTDRTSHFGAVFGRWKPPRSSPELFIRMRVHVVGGRNDWRIIIYPQASERRVGKSPRVIHGVPWWLKREAEQYQRQIEAAIERRISRQTPGESSRLQAPPALAKGESAFGARSGRRLAASPSAAVGHSDCNRSCRWIAGLESPPSRASLAADRRHHSHRQTSTPITGR